MAYINEMLREIVYLTMDEDLEIYCYEVLNYIKENQYYKLSRAYTYIINNLEEYAKEALREKQLIEAITYKEIIEMREKSYILIEVFNYGFDKDK